MILDIYKDSLKYSSKNKKSVLTIGILSLLSFLIIPIIAISGYLYRIVEIGLEGIINTEMMLNTKDLEFNNYTNLFKEGLKLLAITITYLLIPIIITSIFLTQFNFMITNINNNYQLALSLEIFLIILITGLIGFIFINVAIPHMIKNESLKAGYNIKDLIKIIKSVGIGEYILYSISSLMLLFSSTIMIFLIVQLLTSMLESVLNFLSINTHWIILGIPYDLVLYGLVMILIIFPIYLIFQTRSMALLYETNDIDEDEDTAYIEEDIDFM